MRTHRILCVFIMSLIAQGGCSGGLFTQSPREAPPGRSGIAVDPYVVGAVFCEDKNGNNTCDEDEQVSSRSDQNGLFVFDELLSEGSVLVLKEPGTHNGVPYELDDISRQVDVTDGTLVVSPLTTLGTRGLTPAQVTQMLRIAGLDDITEADVTADPMSGIADLTGAVTEAQLARIRASIAVYACLRIINGSQELAALSGEELFTSATDTENGAVYTILAATIQYVRQGLDPAVMEAIQTQLDTAPIAMPPVTALDVVRTAVSITDFLAGVGYEKCNETGGDVAAALSAVAVAAENGSKVAAWASDMGQRYYGADNKLALQFFASFLPQPIQDGINCSSGTFVITDEGVVECFNGQGG